MYLEEAIHSHQEAIKYGLETAVEMALTSARNWGNWAFERQSWEEAVQAYGYAQQASERLVQIQLVRRSKESWLHETQGLPARASYVLARTGDLPSAVVALEEGRALLLSEALERNQADLEILQRTYPDQYEQYQQAAEKLNLLERHDVGPEKLSLDIDLASEVRAACQHMNRAIEDIRRVPGYEDFLRSPTFTDIQTAAASIHPEGALAYLATTPAGSVAFIVTADGVQEIWSDFTDADLDDLLVQYDGEEVVGGYLFGQFIYPAFLEEVLAEILPLLGEHVMAPVASHLRAQGISQVNLIPTGRLALLPLHAASYQAEGDVVYFLDEFTVAYAPNARTLATAKRMIDQNRDEPCLVGVGNPLPHPKPLHATQAELEEIAALFPERPYQLLYGERATRETLLELLSEGNFLHFACHGVFNQAMPLESRLELSNGDQLTLKDFVYGTARLTHVRLAVLSACQSAISDFHDLPDEFIGLPTGFLQAGVTGVVGTLWPVHDLSTALVMVKFYEFHFHGDNLNESKPMPPAQALRQAQRWVRDATNEELADFFDAYPKLKGVRRQAVVRMSQEAVLAEPASVDLDDPQTRPFADKPYHWAPFIFVGA